MTAYFWAEAGRPAGDFRDRHLDARDDVCAAAYMADAACTKAPKHSAAVWNAPPRSPTRARRLNIAHTAARIAAPAFPIADTSAVATVPYGAATCAKMFALSAPTSTLALGTAPPLRVTCPMLLDAARAAARTAVATVSNRLATNLCVVGTRRHVRRILRASAYGDSCDDVAIENLSTQRRCLFVRFMRCVTREFVQGAARSLIDHYIVFGP